jgi:kumamolisin
LLLQTAALQGQNIFAASGDGGSNSCESDEGGNQLSTSDPDAQPFVTSVGGTSLNTSNGKYQSERVWNNHQYRQDGGGNKGASGGGISHYWPMPDWQRAPGLPDSTSSSEPCQVATHSSGKYCRQVPDVSLHADPHKGYWIYCTVSSQCDKDDPWTVMGGTSAAAPLWAALMALVEEKSLKTYGHRVGFVTPLLYQIARDPQMYAASFHDVRTGHTDYNDENQGLYPARSGYDMATGLGSYNAPALANNLIKLGHLRHGGR